ncbi:MAG TPA: heme exporter protein CcmB [Alphaproteobacteria bacterium]
MNGQCYLLKNWVYRSGFGDGLAAQTILFFVVSLCVAVFAIGSESELLIQVVPGLIWVLTLLSSLLGLPDLLNRDAQDGTLDDMVLSKHPLPMLMLIKIIAHWAATGLPLSIIAPAILYTMDGTRVFDPAFVLAGLLAGSLYFSALGLAASALVLQARRSFALYAVIVLPLSIPGLIFGAGSLSQQAQGLSGLGGFYLLTACAVLAVTLIPFASAWIVRMKVAS